MYQSPGGVLVCDMPGFKFLLVFVSLFLSSVTAQPQSTDAEQDYASGNRDLMQQNPGPMQDYPAADDTNMTPSLNMALPPMPSGPNDGAGAPMLNTPAMAAHDSQLSDIDQEQQPVPMQDMMGVDGMQDNQQVVAEQNLMDQNKVLNAADDVMASPGDTPVPNTDLNLGNPLMNTDETETFQDGQGSHFDQNQDLTLPDPSFSIDTNINQNFSNVTQAFLPNFTLSTNPSAESTSTETTTSSSSTTEETSTSTTATQQQGTETTLTSISPTLEDLELFPLEPERERKLKPSTAEEISSTVQAVTRRRHRRFRTTTTTTTTTPMVPVWVERAERRSREFFPALNWCKNSGKEINTRERGVPINLLPKYGRVGF